MSRLGKFVLIRSHRDWEQACDELAAEIAKQRGLASVSIEFPRQPTSYPCLMAAIPVPVDSSLIETIDTAQILCSFVYPPDAVQLLAACREGQPELVVAVPANQAVGNDGCYLPSVCEFAVLVFALVSELKAVGALKKSNLLAALHNADKWLLANQEQNKIGFHFSEAAIADVVDRFWEAN